MCASRARGAPIADTSVLAWRFEGIRLADDDIPALARGLIEQRIHSIEALEVVLALRERGNDKVSVRDLSAKLRISVESTEGALAELVNADLVSRHGDMARYQPASAELQEAVEALVVTYEHKRVETLVLISKNAIGRVRNDALKTFAEAFRVRGRKDDG
jgi:hypothetical protein